MFPLYPCSKYHPVSSQIDLSRLFTPSICARERKREQREREARRGGRGVGGCSLQNKRIFFPYFRQTNAKNYASTWTQSWSTVVKVMTLSSPFNQWEIFVFGEIGNSLFSKGVHNPSIFLGPHPYPIKSPVLRWRPVLSLFPTRVQRSHKSARK